MNILVVDASEKRAAIKSRRILSRWFPQLGADTYAGRLSEEGLADLVRELKSIASKNSAIAIHRIASRDRLELVTIVGRRSAFDSEGRWAFRTRQAKPTANQTPTAEVLLLCLKLAALFHDLGKANEAFQRKLQRAIAGKGTGQRAERVRHEVLSFYLLHAAFWDDVLAGKSDDSWLARLELDPAAGFDKLVGEDGRLRLRPGLDEAVQAFVAAPETSAGNLLGALSQPLKTWYKDKRYHESPVYALVSWLVLTHHRLPSRQSGFDRRGEVGLDGTLANHLNAFVEAQPDNLRIAVDHAPWRDNRWQEAVKATVTQLRALLQTHGKGVLPETTTLLGTLAHVLRPLLITGDQLASVVQEDVYRRRQDPDSPLANTCRGGIGDRLSTHLVNVSRRAALAWRIAHQPDAWFPKLGVEDLPSTSAALASLAPDSPYVWQQKAAQRVAQAEGIATAPFFGVLMAAPGSGKTIAGPRVLLAASGGRARWTLALGLKSLTLQSGASYEDKLGIPPDQLATVIGDRAAATLFAAERECQAQLDRDTAMDTAQPGSDTLEAYEEPVFFNEGSYEAQGDWLEALQPAAKVTSAQAVYTPALVRFIDTPVVACTVDHLAHVAELVRAGEARGLLRVISSDLILDEIDNYGAADLVTLGKLVYQFGLFGRRVLLMSGTVPPTVIQALYQAWQQGLAGYRLRTGQQVPGKILLAGNLGEPVLFDEVAPESFLGQYQPFAAQFAAALQALPQKVFAEVLPLDAQRPFASIYQGALALHDRHALRDPVTGKRISIGYVRFNATGGAQRFARYLLNREAQAGEPTLKVVCYHSRFPRLTRCLTEQFLDQALARHAEEVPRHDLIQAALSRANDGGLMVLVATTSIQETGRDHDYDWAISEPSSTRSVVQAAGRIRRHRARGKASPNFAILATTLRAVRQAARPYGYAGVQDNEAFSQEAYCLVDQPQTGSKLVQWLKTAGIAANPVPKPTLQLGAETLLPMAEYRQGINPSSCLLTPAAWEDNRLGSLFAVEFQQRLLNRAGESVSLADYLGAGASEGFWLDSYHAEQTRFRRSSSGFEAEVYLGGGDFSEVGWKGEDGVWRPLPCRRLALTATERALLDFSQDLRGQAEQLQARYQWPAPALEPLKMGRARVKHELTYKTTESFGYHPLLGFLDLSFWD